jgi:hypothetical protein
MRLNQGNIRPGRVLQVVDEIGTIKAMCPGVFSELDDPSLLPPVYPFFCSNSNTFTKVNKGDEVWIMFFDDNPYELFYFRKDNIQESLATVLSKDYEQIEVLASVEAGICSYAQLFYTDGTGWVLRNGDSNITINPDGDIILNYQGQSHRQISIDNTGISLGTTGGSSEPAVLGDQLTKTLNNIYSCFKTLSETAKLNPYTAHLSTALEMTLTTYKDSIAKIKSQNVTLD